MFSIVRLLIVLTFLCCSILIIKHSVTSHKFMLKIVLISISFVLLVALNFWPFENLFVTFNSPQSVYEYYSFDKSNIDLVVDGNNCDFVVKQKKDVDKYLIIPKTADGWKIGVGAHTRRIAQKIVNGIVICVYQYRSTDDYFITILDTSGGQTSITDNYNTKFYSLEQQRASLGTFTTYYGHIANFNALYKITINGDNIVFENYTK